MNRREFFRGARTAVVGGVAAGATLALGLPALPKKRVLALGNYPHWRKFHEGVRFTKQVTDILNEPNAILDDMKWQEGGRVRKQ